MIEINKIKDIILKQKTVILIPIFIIWFLILQNWDEKTLISEIKNTKNNNINIENNINILNNELNIWKLSEVCLKSQLDRLINWLEYNINYCQWENLNKFEGLK